MLSARPAVNALVGVSGPPEAIYSYLLSVFIDVSSPEDECEC